MFGFHLFLLRLARGLTKTVIETSVQALMEVVNKITGRPFQGLKLLDSEKCPVTQMQVYS